MWLVAEVAWMTTWAMVGDGATGLTSNGWKENREQAKEDIGAAHYFRSYAYFL